MPIDMSKVVLTYNDDGTVKIDARGMKGTKAELEQQLGALAREIGGKLVIEEHEPGAHGHDHSHDHVHVRGGKE